MTIILRARDSVVAREYECVSEPPDILRLLPGGELYVRTGKADGRASYILATVGDLDGGAA